MGSDIVARLRVWSDWLNERCPDTEVRNDLRAAADEIERLRKERDDAEPLLNELWERRTQSTEMRAEIERLRRDYSCICNEMRRMTEERDEAKAEAIRSDLRMADAEFERDEARRLYCESLSTSRHGRKQVAASRNWDCYEENPRGENDEDDANG